MAVRYLEACTGNLEMAIGMHMDQEEANTGAHQSSSRTQPDRDVRGLLPTIGRASLSGIEEETGAAEASKEMYLFALI